MPYDFEVHELLFFYLFPPSALLWKRRKGQTAEWSRDFSPQAPFLFHFVHWFFCLHFFTSLTLKLEAWRFLSHFCVALKTTLQERMSVHWSISLQSASFQKKKEKWHIAHLCRMASKAKVDWSRILPWYPVISCVVPHFYSDASSHLYKCVCRSVWTS